MKRKGIEMDYGKADRYIFLQREKEHHKMNTFIKVLLFLGAMYFLGHIGYALSAETIIINQPNGGQTICIVQGAFVTCY